MSAEPPVLVEQDGHVLLVTLNRPDKRNAINCESMCLLDDAWRRLDGDDDVRVAILTGNGSTFCAGMDLKEIVLLGEPEPADEHIARVQADTEIIWRAWLKTDRPAKPVILAAEGFARAGGTEILQGTDLRVGERARCSASPRCSGGCSPWPDRRFASVDRSGTRWRRRCCSAVTTSRPGARTRSA